MPTDTESRQTSLDSHWMPFTANREFKKNPRLQVRAEGVYYWNDKGEKILDGCSGLFCVAAGHGRAEIQEAVARQLGQLDYTPHFQFGFPDSFRLANQLAELTPGTLNHIFFTNSGSESVDTALKIALAYHRARGEGHRNRLAGRERAYHGVNFGGLSVGGIGRNRQACSITLPGVMHLRHTWLEESRFTKGQPEQGAYLADDLERMVATCGDTIAACIVEPIAGSTGVLVPPKGYLERLRNICTRHGILLIFDEVITGFGRVGKAFGSQAFGVTPDLICMAKALTNGCLPMGAVAASDDVYRSIVDASAQGGIEFFHGYTYSGAPASVAAALATLEIYRRERLFDRAAASAPLFLDGLFSQRDLPVVSDIRGYGMLGAIDLRPASQPGQRGSEVFRKLYARGLMVRLSGDSILLAPPLVASREQIEEITGRLGEVLAAI